MELTTLKTRLAHIPPERYPETGRLLVHFLDVTATATGRASYYNRRGQAERAAAETHQAVFDLDRGIYSLMLALPGVMDRARQTGLVALLGHPRNGRPGLLELGQETQVINHLAGSLPPQRLFKLFGWLQQERVNNTRTRKLILRSILAWPDLEWISIKYRRKLRAGLTHAWGKRTASIIREILAKSHWKPEELKLINRYVTPYLPRGSLVEVEGRLECLCFILGGQRYAWSLPRLRAYLNARREFQAGAPLPPEVMEGIRSTFHPARSPADVLDLTKRQATTGQRIAMQRSAQEKGVKIEFDPTKYDLSRLYVYAYEMGTNNGRPDRDMAVAMAQKAQAKAASLPWSFDHVGIVVDTSESMKGSGQQKWRPIAIAMGLHDMLIAASERSTVCYSHGTLVPMPVPGGDTDLAKVFLEVAKEEPEAIFIITDGYENSPAGRLAEVVARWRDLGYTTPLYQLSPVLAAEAHGLRPLAPDIAALPVNQDLNLGMGMVKLMLTEDFLTGLAALVSTGARLVSLPAVSEKQR